MTLEKIVSDYPTKPILEDRGVPEHDVFGRLSDEDYEAFYDDVCEAAIIARSCIWSRNSSRKCQFMERIIWK